MSDSNKVADLKEKLKQALNSTFKVISDDFKLNDKFEKTKNSKKLDHFELGNLNSKNDFIKARAESDSSALKRKFSDDDIFKKNLPSNSSCKSLYTIAEKIRYESLGSKMLKGIEKNFKDNYNQMISSKRKDQLKTKEDVSVAEAFELYMLKNFHNLELNSLTTKMLSFWENDFDGSINKHIKFLKENLENQYNYSSKFSEILAEMDIFQSEEKEENKEDTQEDGQNNPSNEDENSETNDNKDQNKEEETEANLDSDYNIDEYKLDEQLIDTDSDQINNEQIIQKKNLSNLDNEYKIFTNQYDEIIKAENLENSDESIRRIVTLSPRTDMAKNFHLRNGAKEIATHVVTVNFEYEVKHEEASY